MHQMVAHYLQKTYDTDAHLKRTKEKLKFLKASFDEKQYQKLVTLKPALKRKGEILDHGSNDLYLKVVRQFGKITYTEAK